MVRPLRVLLIDSDPVQAARLGEVLKGVEGLELFTCETLDEGIEHLSSPNGGQTGVVLLDVAGGLDDLHSLRKSFAEVAIIALTGDRAVALQALDEGAQDHLDNLNPAPEILERALRYAFERHAGLLELSQAKERFETALTARRTAEDQLHHQVLHDALTGLPNRLLLFDRLRQSLERAKRLPGSVAVIFIDLDGFKMINDSMGHDAGDELLREVANRVVTAVRPSDTVARLGSDEFVVVCETLPNESEATSIARRIEESVSAPCFLESGEARVTASLGIVFASPQHTEPDTLIREADTAMFLAKSRGKDRHEVFDEALRQRAEAKLRTQDKLSRAIEDNRLFLEYQPIVSMATGALRGVEALLRYRDPISGVMLPSAFVDIAEESGLILSLGTWALEEACRQAAIWRTEYQSKINVTVNLSPRQAARPRLLETVMNALESSGLEPDGLCLELTESVLMEATDSTVKTLEALRDGGISLGIDDFGTGYTSVTYLRRFPVDFLKIDRSFVEGLPRRRDDAAIVRAVIGLGKGMGLSTIAEGVETEAQRQFLHGAGCDEAQGYYFGRPGHPDIISKKLTSTST